MIHLNLKKFTVEGLDLKINFEAIFRCLVMLYFLFVPTGKEQPKIPFEPPPEINVAEQLPSAEQKKPRNSRPKTSRKRSAKRF